MRPQDGPLGLRRATRMFALVAWAGAVLVAVMGVVMLLGATGTGAATTSLRTTAAPGSALEVPTTTATVRLWAWPATVDPAVVTCTGTAPSGERPLELSPDGTTATDTAGARDVVLLLEVRSMPRVDEITCSGDGLEGVGLSLSADAGLERGFGVVLLLLAPVLVVLGLVARRAAGTAPGAAR